MPYIGREPTKGEFKKVDVSSWTFNDSATSFPLGYQVGEVNQMVVSLNGVIQQPTTDFVLADGGTNIVFVTAPETGDSCFVLTYGDVGGVSVPDASITLSKLETNLKSFTEDHFTASGDSDTYTLSETPPSKSSILVSVDGIVQAESNYYLSTNQLSFDSNLDSDASLRVVHMGMVSGVTNPLNGTVANKHMSSDIMKAAGIRVNRNELTEDVTIGTNERASVAGDFKISATLTVNGVFTVV